MKSASVKKERNAPAYILPLESAEHFCRQLSEKDYVSWYDLLATVVISGIALEALVNTFGEILINNFGDFESSTPVAKVRLLCNELEIEYNKQKKPYCDLIRLVRARNKIVHPKHKVLSSQSKEMPLKEADRELRKDVLTEAERSLNPIIAKQSLQAVKSLRKIFEQRLIEIGQQESIKQWRKAELIFNEKVNG